MFNLKFRFTAMKIEATKYRVKIDKTEKAGEMLKMLNNRIDECIQTLEREKMFIEAIFSEVINGRLYLTWFSVQGDNAEIVNSSPFQIDKDYLEMFDECIDKTFKPEDKKLELFLFDPLVNRLINELNEKA